MGPAARCRPRHRPQAARLKSFRANCLISSVTTLNRTNWAYPKAVDIATSAASATLGDHNAPDTRVVVPGIHGEPAAIEKHFIPAAEVHGVRVDRHADVSEVTCAISRRNVHATRQRYSQMGIIAADTAAFFVTFRCRPVSSRILIAELDTVVHIIADGLCPLPTGLHAAEQGPGKIRQLLGIAIAARQQERQDVVRQIADSPLPRISAHPRQADHCRRR